MITRTIRLHVALSERYPDAPSDYYHRVWRALPCLARRAEHDYPDARYDYPDARYSTTTIKPAPNAEANEAGGADAAGVKTKCHPVFHREDRKFHSPNKQTASPRSGP